MGANKTPMQQNTHEMEDAAPLKTSTTPREDTRTDQDVRTRVLASAKDIAASMGAGPTAGSRACVCPTTTARARAGASVSTVIFRW